MTWRQVFKLLRIVNRADLIEFYNSLLSYATVHGSKIISQDEFLNLALGNKPVPEKAFDDETDKILEAEALKRLEQMRAKRGK